MRIAKNVEQHRYKISVVLSDGSEHPYYITAESPASAKLFLLSILEDKSISDYEIKGVHQVA